MSEVAFRSLLGKGLDEGRSCPGLRSIVALDELAELEDAIGVRAYGVRRKPSLAQRIDVLAEELLRRDREQRREALVEVRETMTDHEWRQWMLERSSYASFESVYKGAGCLMGMHREMVQGTQATYQSWQMVRAHLKRELSWPAMDTTVEHITDVDRTSSHIHAWVAGRLYGARVVDKANPSERYRPPPTRPWLSSMLARAELPRGEGGRG